VDPQIHAAIVGGLIGGATLAGGVILDLRLRGRRDRRRELEAVVEEIDKTNRQAVKMAAVGSFNVDGFGAALERMTELTGEARRLAGAAGRNADEVRDAAGDLSDMWLAIIMRAAKELDAGRPMGEDKMTLTFTLAMPVRRMNEALYGKGDAGTPGVQRSPFERLDRYIQHGLSAPELDAGAAQQTPP
jgi:hypothetical protein